MPPSRDFGPHFETKGVDAGKACLFTFLDMSKAFDRVWHRGLTYKMERMGITGELLAWITDYLHKRKHQVAINGQTSIPAPIKAGVPQGSILGPLCFLIYMDDLSDLTDADIRMYGRKYGI